MRKVMAYFLICLSFMITAFAFPGTVLQTRAAATEPYGLNAMSAFDRLPYLKLDTQAGGQSSYDRTEGNTDWGNYLYSMGTEQVLLDQVGPGTVYRMWFTGINQSTDYIKVYFDGETTPRINMLIADLASGVNAPFSTPLVANDAVSSGGFTCYLPLPYSKSIKIVSNATSNSFYYNIGYHKYSPDTPIATWTGTEDSSAVQTMWNNAGTDPKNDTGNTVVTGTANLNQGATQTLLDTAGPDSISSIKIKIPGVTLPTSTTDDGRAHKGSSQFVAALNPSNSGVMLTRRMDYEVGNQRAGVYVDGAYVGDWYDAGQDQTFHWHNSSFYIPSSFTAGKSSITIQLQFVSSDNDWNEFYYWVDSIVNGVETQTDTLDVGNASSESSHNYVINTQTWSGSRTFQYPGLVQDDGRADKGYSQFVAAINPSNSGITLTRRMDYGIGNQKASVYVDGAYVGDWTDSGSDGTYRFRDSSFTIPSSFTAGKSSITVKVQFVSSDNDWNEFYYWVYSNVSGTNTLTDSLDVGNTTSESAHSYIINTPTWSGTRNYEYNVQDLLNNTEIKIFWDNESTPSVDAPLGSFFAMGQFGNYGTRSLPAGMDASGNLYMYFPMPFQSHAKIQLVNNRSMPTNGITFEVRYKPFTDSFNNVGYFKTQFNSQQPTTLGNDIVILDTTGAGQLVGVVESMNGQTPESSTNPNPRWYLEGDERILVDDSSSPAIEGTGTEDFFNGGWYFQNGPYTLQMNGNTAHVVNSVDSTAAYRFFLQDAVPFRKHIRMTIQHGATDDVNENVWTLAYYYQKPNTRAVLTDTLDVGNASSEASHAYSITNQSWSGSRTYTYEGEGVNTNITDDGRAHQGTSQFTMAIQPSNQGLLLRRRFDQGIANQEANVYVDGALVGTWYRAGSNTSHNWRDDDFLIPASFTNGKSSIHIQIQFVSSALDWNEFTYWAYTETP